MSTTSHVKKVPIHLQSAQNRLLIKNGRIVNEDGIADGDVYIEEGIIKQLGRNLIIPGGTRVIDARGKLIMPGGIDPHTHFEMEFMGSVSADDFYQGTKAAIAGGTTTIIDFVIPRSDETLLEAYMRYREKADSKVCCDYALHVCVTSWSERQRNEIKELTAKHGINSYKVFMAYSFALRDAEIYQLMDTCKSIGALTMVHAENGDVINENTKKLLAKGVTGVHGHELSRNEEVEAEAVNRACTIAKQVESPLYVVHVMSQSAAQTLNQCKSNSQTKIIGETLAAALGTDGTHYYHADWYHAARHILSPPLRPNKETPKILMHYLAEDKLHLTGSDNCTFTAEQKALGKNDFSKIPNGVNGVEDRLYVVWEKGVVNGIMDPSRFVAVTSTNAAKLFNLYPQKGCIAVGSDADIIVWDPNQTKTISAKTHHHAIDFNIFEGLICHGAPEYVIVNGRVCVDEGELKAVQGFGRFLPTLPFAPYVYGTDEDIAAVEKKRLHSYENELTLDHLNINNGNGPQNAQDEALYNMPTLPNSAVSTPIGKAPRQEGQRNLQSSSFSISSEDPDADDRRSCIRVKNPPGGKSSGGFW